MRLGRAVRATDPGSFAFVMATGIVSAALRLAGQATAATWLLALATGPLRTAMSGVAVVLWALATALIPALAGLSVIRWRQAPPRPGQAWVVVFPLGMYAAAGLTLGAAARLPLIQRAGEAGLWPAAAAWGLTVMAALSVPWRLARPVTPGGDSREAVQVRGPGQDAARPGR